jgi:hypothetical protein
MTFYEAKYQETAVMNKRTSRLSLLSVAVTTFGIGLVSLPVWAGWEHPYGDSSNTGFTAVLTKPAGAGSLSVPELGAFADGAGPVIGPDGSVYLGTTNGKVIALHADGSPYWNRQLPEQQILTSPVIGTDGSVYVVGERHQIIRDHREGETTLRKVAEATLYKFTASGGQMGGGTPFPKNPIIHFAGRGPERTAAPNIWRYGSDEVVMVPAIYTTFGGYDLHLIAFSAIGGVMADIAVAYWGGDDVTGHGWAKFLDLLFGWIGADFQHGTVAGPPGLPPLPRAAIFTNPQGGTPSIVISNHHHDDVLGLTFCVGAAPPCSPATGFTMRWRIHHRGNVMLSPPTILPDLHSVVATDSGVVYSGPNFTNLPVVSGLGGSFGAPTRTLDGRIVIVGTHGRLVVLRDGIIDSQSTLSQNTEMHYSIVPAAASCTNVFVSTSDGLLTYDAAARVQLLKFPWVGGGRWPLAIGPTGRVYAIASNILFIFPPPPQGTSFESPEVARKCGQPPVIGGSGAAPEAPRVPTPEQAPSSKSNR